jgi:hypothetical protein
MLEFLTLTYLSNYKMTHLYNGKFLRKSNFITYPDKKFW